MTTDEFKEKIENLGYMVTETNQFIHVKDKDKDYINVVSIRKNEKYCFNTNWPGFYELSSYDRYEIFKILTVYVEIPLKERESEKKYYWRVKNKNYAGGLYGYLHVIEERNKWTISYKQCNFTEKEYQKMVDDNFIPDIFEKEEI